MLLKMGTLLVSPERFPVKIALTRKLDEQELIKLTIYALTVENGIEPKEG